MPRPRRQLIVDLEVIVRSDDNQFNFFLGPLPKYPFEYAPDLPPKLAPYREVHERSKPPAGLAQICGSHTFVDLPVNRSRCGPFFSRQRLIAGTLQRHLKLAAR